MLRLHPRYTRTYTVFPSTTPFRSDPFCGDGRAGRHGEPPDGAEGGIGAADERVAAISPMSCAAPGPKLMERASTLLSGRRRAVAAIRSEEHTSELQSLIRNSYADFCLKKKNNPELHRQTTAV